MSDPLFTFRATFLHYESLKEPAEMMAKAIMYKKKNENATKVIIALFSRGFYIKGILNHISCDQKKSRQNQFVCAGLLRNVFKLQFKEEFVLWIFHETIELKTEAMLFLFPNNTTRGCNHFFEYLKTLISDRFCDVDVLESFCAENDCQSTISTRRSENSNLISPKYIKKQQRTVKNQSRYILDNSDSRSNINEDNEVFQESFISNKERPLHFTGFFRNSSGDYEEFEDSSETEANQSLQFQDVQYFLHKEDMVSKKNEDTQSVRGQRSAEESIMASDSESMDSSFWKTNPNEYNQLLEQLNGIKTSQFWDLSNFSYYNYFEKDTEKSERNIFDETNIFCWPEYLVSDPTFTTSILVEMTFFANQMTNNWGLLDKLISTATADGSRIIPELIWDERIDRIHYDPIKKTLKVDDDGCLLIYCCRQTSREDETESYY